MILKMGWRLRKEYSAFPELPDGESNMPAEVQRLGREYLVK